jgi:hypothetical protein
VTIHVNITTNVMQRQDTAAWRVKALVIVHAFLAVLSPNQIMRAFKHPN